MDLNKIESPACIKGMDMEQLRSLASEIRRALLQKLSAKGGHVGPNLGFVEATIALHYVFESPKDKIVFDVSHQSYTHKILTGRAYGFTDPARYNDITGYTSPAESAHDWFTVGHTSTSVSLATGLAVARNMQGQDGNVIAVIGDGSLSGGEAFEGLDTGGTLRSNFIVVVNDNDMSIAENHGSLYDNLRQLRDTNGEAPDNFFRAMGYKYVYVADGNNLEALIAAFQSVKDSTEPVVVHLHTHKGMGYAPAEQDKEEWHWNVPFDLATGQVPENPNAPQSYADLTYQILSTMMKDDPRVVVLNAGTPGTVGFYADRREAVGGRFIDVGIAEEQAAAMASGLAKGGMRPYWGVASTFVQRAYDQISQDIAINGNPVVIGLFGGGLYGMTDVTHLCWFDIAMISNIPGLMMLAPSCGKEYSAMLTWAMRQTQMPVVLRNPGFVVQDLDIPVEADYSTPRMQTVHQGSGIAIVAVGDMLGVALKALPLLAQYDLNPTVINARCVSHLDTETLNALRANHQMVVTIENGVIDGGFGQKVASYYGMVDMQVLNLGLPHRFMDRYNAAKLAADCGLTPESLTKRILTVWP